MFRNLIFDCSGTLVDDPGPVIEATNHVPGVYGKPTLADEIADLVLERHSANELMVKIRKFILPQTDCVGVDLLKGR